MFLFKYHQLIISYDRKISMNQTLKLFQKSKIASCYAVMQIERHNLQNTMRLLSDFEKCTVINDWWNGFR